MSTFPAIMCGGSGTRLWPLSRGDSPKQFVRLLDGGSTFQETIRRAAALTEATDPLVVAGAAHEAAVRRQLAEIGSDADLLLEPEARDSAAAMAATAAWICERDPDGVAVILAADHFVPEEAAFAAAIDEALIAAREGWIVTLGVRPTEATAAYGYIESDGQSVVGGCAVQRVRTFVEKPTESIAEAYVRSGYLWNSGNFVVRADVLLRELDAYQPAVAAAARAGLRTSVLTPSGSTLLGEGFRTAPRISIDHAVMEKTGHAAVLPVTFAWTDLGAWDAVLTASQTDAAGNSVKGETVLIESSRVLVRAGDGLIVAAVGLSDVAIIAERDAVLVCALDASQQVKQVSALAKLGPRPPVEDAAPTSIEAFASWYREWMFTRALPLWWALGADHQSGGFHESLDLTAVPTGAPRRARVQARQAYAYATAGHLGWSGPWRQASQHGLDYLLSRYRMASGLLRTSVTADGAPLDDTAVLYDHAFALLAMAGAHRAIPEQTQLADQADALMQLVEQAFAHPSGGFREAGVRPFQANPQMHLLEAALAWAEAGGGGRWDDLAARIAKLALERFIDEEGGFLREYFDAEWRPANGELGRIVEPGHQFEWAWLLHRWGKRAGDGRSIEAARRLVLAGERGVDRSRGVVVAELHDDLTIRKDVARLWPQAERLKAALVCGGDPSVDGLAAAHGLSGYLATRVGGLWRDKQLATGLYVDEAIPASSLYHLVGALEALVDVAP